MKRYASTMFAALTAYTMIGLFALVPIAATTSAQTTSIAALILFGPFLIFGIAVSIMAWVDIVRAEWRHARR